MGKSIWDTRFGKQKKALAFDECLKVAGWAIDDWITVHPNGPDNLGRHVELDGEGRIINGMGGVHNGKKLSEIGIKSAFPKEYHGEETNPDNIDNPHFVDRVWGYNAEIKENERKAVEGAKQKITLTAASLPKAFTSTPKDAASAKRLTEFINAQENINSAVLSLYNQMGDIVSASGKPELTLDHGAGRGYFQNNANISALEGRTIPPVLKAPEVTGDNSDLGHIEANVHEMMHAMDYYLADKDSISTLSSISPVNIQASLQYEQGQADAEVKALFAEARKERDEIDAKCKERLEKGKEEINERLQRGEIKKGTADRKLSALRKEISEDREAAVRNIMGGGMHSFQDIYDAISFGTLSREGEIFVGHGAGYWFKEDAREKELLADYAALCVVRPEYVEILRRDRPRLTKALDEYIKAMSEWRRKNETA